MSFVGIILFIFLILSSTYVFLTLRDPASPQLMFLVKLGFYFAGIYFLDYDYEIYLVFILILIVLIHANNFYIFSSNNVDHNLNIQTRNKNAFKMPSNIFWIMSLPAILALYYLISKFGGFSEFFEVDGFLQASKVGTRSFAGLGISKTLITTFYVVHLYYFSYIINLNFKKYKVTYFFYGIHFLIFLFIASISFSRGTLLGMFVLMGLMWHYSRKRINTFVIVAGISFLIFVALVLGVVRETVSFRDGEISLNYSFKENELKKTDMIIGTFPLQTLLNAEKIDKKLGLTYLSGITIFVPRSIWPGKPDPGGVVFTKTYTSLYDEYSDFTTGMFPEAIINFGVLFGIIFATLQLILLVYWLNTIYIKLIYNNKNSIIYHKDILHLLFYVYTLKAGSGLLTGEFTNIFKNWIVQIVILYIVYILINITNRIRVK